MLIYFSKHSTLLIFISLILFITEVFSIIIVIFWDLIFLSIFSMIVISVFLGLIAIFTGLGSFICFVLVRCEGLFGVSFWEVTLICLMLNVFCLILLISFTFIQRQIWMFIIILFFNLIFLGWLCSITAMLSVFVSIM